MVPLEESIASFSKIKIPGTSCLWLAETTWNSLEKDYFRTLLSKHNHSLLRPNIDHSKYPEKRPQSASLRLLLTTENRNDLPKAIAIIETFRQRFAMATINYQFSESVSLEEDTAYHSILTLIACSFFSLRTDQTRLISTAKRQTKIQKLDSVGETSKISVMNFRKGKLAGQGHDLISFDTRDISREDWNQNFSRHLVYQSLSYLELKRKRREQVYKKKQTPSRKRGIVARLFNPKIDDALL